MRSAATDKYANGGAVGSRCMILAGSAVRNPVSSHRPKKNSAVTRLPRPPQSIFVCTGTFQGACYLKGPHLEKETFLSASFTKEPELRTSDKCFAFFCSGTYKEHVFLQNSVAKWRVVVFPSFFSRQAQGSRLSLMRSKSA